MISIIVPAYNRKKLILATIASIYQQKVNAELDIVVVNDGSTDGTADLVKDRFPEIRVISQPNRGASSARNRGVNHAYSEFVAFCDSDDLMLPGRLQTQYDFLRNNSSAVIVAGNLLDFDSCKGVAKECRFDHKVLGIDAGGSGIAKKFLKNCIEAGNPLFNTGMCKRSAFIKCGGFAESLQQCEDFELRARIATCGEVGIIDRPLMLFRNDRHVRLSRERRDDNPYELMVDHWLQACTSLISGNREFERHVREWAGHVVMQSYSGGSPSGFRRVFAKYEKLLSIRQLSKSYVASALVALRG